MSGCRACRRASAAAFRSSARSSVHRTRSWSCNHGCATMDACYCALCDVAELLRLGEALQLLQRLVLDLADALARHVERAPDLVQRARVLAAQAVAELEDAALAVGEVLQRLAQRLLREDLGRALVRGLGPLVGD